MSEVVTAEQVIAIYREIYGEPTQATHDFANDVAGRWIPDQVWMWLRSRPEYVHSDEYLKRARDLARRMGLIADDGDES